MPPIHTVTLRYPYRAELLRIQLLGQQYRCYTVAMPINTINAVECLVEDYGWDAVIEMLLKEAATAPDDRLDEIGDLVGAAIAVNEGKGQLLVL